MGINKLIIGNMKMNLTLSEVSNYMDLMYNYKDNFIICSSSLYIPFFIDKGYSVGIQNISEYGMGAYTGEISVNQISSMNIKYCLIGHSERRIKFNESDKVINNKVRNAVSNGVTAILCIGESLEQKNSNKTKEFIKEQIKNDLNDIEISYLKNIIVAYEPIWSIGTGNILSIKEIEDIIDYIKETIKNIYGINIKVLYGGSINEVNINSIKEINNLDGFLVGGACLVPDKFIKIIETIN